MADIKIIFVGGAKHSETETVRHRPDIGEHRRVLTPAGPDTYIATGARIAIPGPLGQPVHLAYEHVVWVVERLNPDRGTHAAELFGQALADALTRAYVIENGSFTDLLAAKETERFTAWCDTCDRNGRNRQEFDNPNDRAAWMNDHMATTGHTARWSNESE